MVPGDPISLFLAAARAHQARPAVVEDARTWTYDAFLELVLRLAHDIAAAGVDHPRVTLLLEKGAHAYAAMFATLYAGGTYCPHNLTNPPTHAAKMVERFEPHVVIAGSRSLLDGYTLPRKARIITTDRGLTTKTLATPRPPDPLAYVMFTSGSTGEPKGVMVGRAGLGHYTRWAQQAMAVTPDDRWSQHPNIAFDLSVLDIYGALCSGAALVPLSAKHALEPALAIHDQQLTIWNSVPSVIDLMVRAGHVTAAHLGSLRLMTFCGEPLLWTHLDAVHAARPDLVVHNTYGPTEATVSCTLARLDRASPREPTASVPIGRPIEDTSIHILDEHMQLAPVGVAGEIYIGGVQVAHGYLHEIDLTEERFVADPFGSGGRLYRTGDLGRCRADGTLEFLGRNDFQIKLRGHRIELGEIEITIGRVAGVQRVVVHLREDEPGAKRLVAYYTGSPAGGDVALRRHAEANLPRYMVPAAYVRLDGFPLTANGKLDRNALPAPIDEAEGSGSTVTGDAALDERSKIRSFIERTFARGSAFSDDDNLIELGILDSLGARELVPFLEDTFGIRFDDTVIFDERFPKLSGLVELVAAQRR
jgi:amino acid adenylation domain-containing protein